MSVHSWLENLKTTCGLSSGMRRLSQRARRRPSARRLIQLEALEDRHLFSTFTVKNTSDSGAGSFRNAITQVNADPQPGVDTINFAIGTEAQTIMPATALPAITHPVVIDGTSQPGFAGKPLIVLVGNANVYIHNGLEIAGGGSIVRGMEIDSFNYADLVLDGSGGDSVAGNYLGMKVSGGAAVSEYFGLQILGVSNNTIGGTTAAARNLINGLGIGAVSFSGSATDPASFNLIEGNSIGTDVTGTKGGWKGLTIYGASHNTIGGITAAAGNLIFAVSSYGAASFNLLEGNDIGTDVTGTKALNGGGVQLYGSGAYNTIGGTTAGAGNLISGNALSGVSVRLDQHDLVEGNDIGTDVTGTLPLPNGLNGIVAGGWGNSTIGGTAAGAGNTIAFNRAAGVSGAAAILENSIFGNRVGINSPSQAACVLTSAVSSGGKVTIVGTLSSTPSSGNRLEFFSNPAGTSQGQTYLGFITTSTDSAGNGTFIVTLAAAVTPGQVITATATDPAIHTSGFSGGEAVTAGSGAASAALQSLVRGVPLGPSLSMPEQTGQAPVPAATAALSQPLVSPRKSGVAAPQASRQPSAALSYRLLADVGTEALDRSDAPSWIRIPRARFRALRNARVSSIGR